jgi:hypothetical protein
MKSGLLLAASASAGVLIAPMAWAKEYPVRQWSIACANGNCVAVSVDPKAQEQDAKVVMFSAGDYAIQNHTVIPKVIPPVVIGCDNATSNCYVVDGRGYRYQGALNGPKDWTRLNFDLAD